MKTWKLVLLVSGCLVGGCGLLVGGGVWWLQKNGPQLQEEGKRVKVEAHQFGQGKQPQLCESEGLKRLDACDGLMCAVKMNLFVEACLEAAEQDPDYCKSIPPESEIMESAKYRVARCQEVGREGNLCQQLFGATQKFCDSLLRD